MMPQTYNLNLNKMMFVSLNSYITGVTSGAGTANPSGATELTSVVSEIRVPQFLVFFVLLCGSLFSVSLFFWSLYLLSFFDLRLLITPLVTSIFFLCS